MRSLQKIFFLIFITVICAPSYAAVNSAAINNNVIYSIGLASCSVFNEADSAESEAGEKEEEEEPDCE